MVSAFLVATYRARVSIRSYADVTVEAEDQEQASDYAIDAAIETPFPEISDVEIDWIEEDERAAAPEK